jgi:hypothetical protein
VGAQTQWPGPRCIHVRPGGVSGKIEWVDGACTGRSSCKWLRRPDPGYAVTLALNVAEYHIPKLARTEINGEIGIRGKLIISD